MYPPPRIWAPQIDICAFVAGVFTGGGGLKNQLKKVAIGIDTTCFASDNSGSETNIRVGIFSFLYADFVPSHLDDQVDLDSENWHHSAKPCGGLTQRRVQLHESFRGNIGAKP